MKLSGFIEHMSDMHNNATEYYEDMNYDIVPGLKGINRTARWMNVGYWQDCSDYNSACQKLAHLLSVVGKFSPEDQLLDVGCGCGEQDRYWAKIYDGISITAMDIVEKQVAEAKKQTQDTGKSVVTFMKGDAGKLAFASESFTKVSALDCEYHFATREKFYNEAYRVLKKNGRLTVTDMLPKKGEKWNRPLQKKWRRGIFIPDENMYDYHHCIALLKKAGFREIDVKVISHEVFTGLAWYFVKRFLSPRKPIDEVKINVRKSSFKKKIYPAIWGFLFGTSEYVVITAMK